jgi:hypothetical protein
LKRTEQTPLRHAGNMQSPVTQKEQRENHPVAPHEDNPHRHFGLWGEKQILKELLEESKHPRFMVQFKNFTHYSVPLLHTTNILTCKFSFLVFYFFNSSSPIC